MSDEAEFYPALSEIFRELSMHAVALRPELTARDVLGWGSFKQIEIIEALEQRYGIRSHTREMDTLRSVGDLARTLAQKTIA